MSFFPQPFVHGDADDDENYDGDGDDAGGVDEDCDFYQDNFNGGLVKGDDAGGVDDDCDCDHNNFNGGLVMVMMLVV